MSIKLSNPTLSTILGSSVAVVALGATSQITLAQTSHADHHHLMIGVDKIETLTRGTYIGKPNPNYNRLSLLFPHQHNPIETSGFHAIGIYGYTGDVNNPTISTSINSQIPETYANLPPLPLVRGTGIFTGKKVSIKTDENMYSDLKTKPVAHLTDDLGDTYVNAIYHSGGNRWNSLLGDSTTIALQLRAITPGLGVADSQGQDFFASVGDIYHMGTGDYFTFKPTFYVSKSAPIKTYSATFKLLDVSSQPTFLESGEFTFNFQPIQTIPEPMTILGVSTALGCGTLFKRKLSHQKKKK